MYVCTPEIKTSIRAEQTFPGIIYSVLVIRPSVAAVLLPVGVGESSCRDVVVAALPPLLPRPISKHARSLARGVAIRRRRRR